MPIFCVKSVKIYTGQKKFTQIYPWDPWQIWGMILCVFPQRHSTLEMEKVEQPRTELCYWILEAHRNTYILNDTKMRKAYFIKFYCVSLSSSVVASFENSESDLDTRHYFSASIFQTVWYILLIKRGPKY